MRIAGKLILLGCIGTLIVVTTGCPGSNEAIVPKKGLPPEQREQAREFQRRAMESRMGTADPAQIDDIMVGKSSVTDTFKPPKDEE